MLSQVAGGGRAGFPTSDLCKNTPHGLLFTEAVPPPSHGEDWRVFLADLGVSPGLLLHPVDGATRVHHLLAWGGMDGGEVGEQEGAEEQPGAASYLAHFLLHLQEFGNLQ